MRIERERLPAFPGVEIVYCHAFPDLFIKYVCWISCWISCGEMRSMLLNAFVCNIWAYHIKQFECRRMCEPRLHRNVCIDSLLCTAGMSAGNVCRVLLRACVPCMCHFQSAAFLLLTTRVARIARFISIPFAIQNDLWNAMFLNLSMPAPRCTARSRMQQGTHSNI